MRLTTKDTIRTWMRLYCTVVGLAMLSALTKIFLQAYFTAEKGIWVSVNAFGEYDLEIVLIALFWVFGAILTADYFGLLKHRAKIQR